MIDRVEEFCGLLRHNGVRVSTAEVIDAARALARTGIDDGLTVRDALRATVIKRREDERTFEELFDLFFLRGAELAGRDDSPLVDALREAGLDAEAIAALLARFAGELGRLDALARMIAGGRAPDLAALLARAAPAVDLDRMVSPLQVGYFAHRLADVLGVDDATRRARAALQRLADADALDADVHAVLEGGVAANVASLRAALRDHVRGQFTRRNLDYAERIAASSLADRPLSQLTEREIAGLRREVVRLARMLRAKVSLQPKRHRRGRLDVRKTLRRSMATAGIPFELRLRERRPKKPRLVVLCDISDSVRNVSRFMLQLVYTLQELFDRVWSFAFVSEIGELTDLFRRHDLERAVDLAYRGAVINVYANSNYGRALAMFADRHLDKVTSRTTVMVIGDGRNNYNTSNAAVLGDIRRRAQRVIWLNPESPAAWGFGDSAMHEYRAHCDKVVVARSLDSLRNVIDELVL